MSPTWEPALRVLVTADAVGGVWQYGLELANALAAHDVETLLAVTGPAPRAAQRAQAAAIPRLRLVHAPFRLEWMKGASRDLARAERWLTALTGDFQPDVVHANGYSQVEGRRDRPVLLTAHSCVRTWWRAVHGGDCPSAWESYVQRVAGALAAADLVVTPTHAHRAAITECYGPIPRCVAIRNGRAPASAARGHKRPLVLAAGRVWDRGKNLGALERLGGDVGWPIYVAGARRGPDGASTSGGERCRYLGRIEDAGMARWLAAAAVFVSPARYEPFGLAVLEAAHSGCALVLSDIATHRELWDGCAVFVDPADPRDIGRGLRRVIEDPILRRSLAARATACARRYRPERMAAEYLAAYRGLATHPAWDRPRGTPADRTAAEVP